MFSIRFLITLALLASLLGFAFQNLSPAIALVFLGFRFQPIPLAFLLLGAIAAGFFTGLVISALLRLSNFLAYQRFRSRRPEPQVSQSRSKWQSPAPSSPPDDAFDFEDPPQPQAYGGSPGKTYEAEPQSRTGAQTGSTYSYRFRKEAEPPPPPKASEPVVDADYRVVNPGPQPPPPPPDYGFEDDDDWIEGDESYDDGFRR